MGASAAWSSSSESGSCGLSATARPQRRGRLGALAKHVQLHETELVVGREVLGLQADGLLERRERRGRPTLLLLDLGEGEQRVDRQRVEPVRAPRLGGRRRRALSLASTTARDRARSDRNGSTKLTASSASRPVASTREARPKRRPRRGGRERRARHAAGAALPRPAYAAGSLGARAAARSPAPHVGGRHPGEQQERQRGRGHVPVPVDRQVERRRRCSRPAGRRAARGRRRGRRGRAAAAPRPAGRPWRARTGRGPPGPSR